METGGIERHRFSPLLLSIATSRFTPPPFLLQIFELGLLYPHRAALWTLAMMDGLPVSPGSSLAKYPSSFSAELIDHCKQGCIPPEVFSDACLLLEPELRQRCVRVNPRYLPHVLGAGVEGVLRVEALASLQTGQLSLTSEEQQWIRASQPYLNSESSHERANFEAASRPSSPLTHSEEHIYAAVPKPILLRLGVAALTGLSLATVQSVPWLPCSVLTLPWSYPMGSSMLFREGVLVSMDAASIAAVVALRPRRGDRVLDLCCAPGMKLGFIADAVCSQEADGENHSGERGLAVGVDVSLPRLYTSRSTLKKQQCGTGVRAPPSDATSPSLCASAASPPLPVCAFVADGRRFTMAAAMASLDRGEMATVDLSTGLTARERRALQQLSRSGAKRSRGDSGAAPTTTGQAQAPAPATPSDSVDLTHVVYAPARARASLAAWQQEQEQRHAQGQGESAEEYLFDRVLVDAECSHDGSVSHVHVGESKMHADMSNPGVSIIKGQGLTNEYRMQHLNLGDGGTQPADASNSSSLFNLQSELLYNGYQQLKPGGTLVYSTCSYSFEQDELVVQRFLSRINTPAERAKNSPVVTAVLVPAFTYRHEAHLAGNAGCTEDAQVAPCLHMESESAEQALQHMLDTHAADYGVLENGSRRYFPEAGASPPQPVGSRFWPRVFSCSFLYVAKIWKRVETVE
ncbi:hypothetical protein ABL78_4659 [Leptomonas seymouri]|uniref:SAM-dependent MTase RsmB/NOP-type domain-containing protein n=1 Tax=Leptomonas seymouri TaxID=5684 RepID=A0A0N0P5B6_LEPSE|nr:hypothetical protein ABL78_4659 [Leptomonas seymouri]|eukprot:KPI86276.1 hypothetical protein ABL78_4659 [Leptomonas seymouri]